jgi:hypothetical protein
MIAHPANLIITANSDGSNPHTSTQSLKTRYRRLKQVQATTTPAREFILPVDSLFQLAALLITLVAVVIWLF